MLSVKKTQAGLSDAQTRLPPTDNLTHLHEDGQALPLALVAMGVGVILVSVLLLAIGVYVRLNSASAGDLLDYYAADAGVERAILPLVANPTIYAGNTTLTLALNDRPVSVVIAPLGSQTIAPSGATLTTTLSTYLVTSQAGDLAVTARIEARAASGAPTATVRIIAWRSGQ
jgi:hypothetical protein